MYDAVVIGAGQAGLAAAYYLKRAGLQALTLEANERVGDVWRQRWEGLQLFTPNRYNSLPDAPFPGAPYALPGRLDVADYLEDYAQSHHLRIRTGARVVSLRQNTTGFSVSLNDQQELQCSNIILATGAYRTPYIPAFANALPAEIVNLHVADLRSPDTWLSGRQRVLVVGAGASGTQVALQLAQRHDITLAGHDPGHIPRSLFGRDIYDYLYGLHLLQARTTSMVGRVLAKAPIGGVIRVGKSVDQLASEAGILRRPRVMGFTEEVVYEDGSTDPHFDAVVYATGYRNAYPFVQVAGALTSAGEPLHQGGISPVNGLYWLGLNQLRRVNSSLLGGVGRDACEIVEHLVEHQQRHTTSDRARNMVSEVPKS